MAITKIHAINATVGKAIEYICNPQKTDDNVLISSFACGRETAEYDFRFSLERSKSPDKNIAYHIIQSFAPGEVSGEEAHRIGQELADRFLQGKYSYVFATHIDRDHIHNHLIFSACNNVDHRKFRSTFREYYRLRSISDELCAEHGKSVIKDIKETGKSYHEWYHDKKGDSWKSQVKKDINECVKKAVTYEEFIRLMKDKGYEINGETFGEGSAKYISFRPFGKDRFVRGRASTLGAEYTKERIKERIEDKASIRADTMLGKQSDKYQNPRFESTVTGFTHNKSDDNSGISASVTSDNTLFSGINTKIIDTSGEKFAASIGLTKWANKENLKRAATIYAELGRLGLQSRHELQDRIKELQEQISRHKESINALGKEISHFDAILRHARYVRENQKYADAYEKSKDQERYYHSHYEQLDLYWGAVNWLKNTGIDTATMNIKQIEEHYRKLIADKNTLTTSYKQKKAESDALKKAEESLHKFLDTPDKNIPVHEKEKKRYLSR